MQIWMVTFTPFFLVGEGWGVEGELDSVFFRRANKKKKSSMWYRCSHV